MGIVEKDGKLNPYALTLIQRKARSLVGKYGFIESDVKDIEQDLWLRLITRESQFNPDKGAETTFIVMVVDQGIATLIAFRKADMRDYRIKMNSLDEIMKRDGKTDVWPHEIVSKDTYMMKAWDSARAEEDNKHRDLDVKQAFQALSLELREIALFLCETSASEVAQATGIPRTTINERRKAIRKLFIKKGIHGY